MTRSGDRLHAAGWKAQTLSSAIAEKLRQDILSGQLSPGERLRQNDLATRFSVSSTPIREALSILTAQGLVRSDDRRGASVFEPTFQDLSENHMIREALESLAIELAVPKLSKSDTEELQSICEDMCATTDAEKWLRLNTKLHMMIYEASQSPMLLELITRMRDLALPYLSLLVGADKRADRGDAEHKEIVKCVIEGDAEGASRHTRLHIRSTVAELESVLHLEESRSE